MAGGSSGKHVSIQDKKRPDGLPSSPAEEAKDVERSSPRVVSARNVEGGEGDNYKPVTPPSTTSSKSSIMQSQGVTIHFHQLELTAQTLSRRTFKPKIKRILKGVSGIARQGTVTALMGPSGCGKTSLLHTLAGKNSSSKISGHILVDGKPRDEGFHHKIGYVEQDDQLTGVLTVRENLMFSAELRLPKAIKFVEKKKRVDDTIELLGLWKCSNTKIGTNLIRGVSGGERKRTSIGMELVVDPAVLFLDEPTSGLDSNTAQNVVKILADLAREGKTIILSIHQPRYSVFRLFDNMMLLGEGEMLYHGSPDLGLEYFKRLNFECEPFNNPADFFMDVVAQQISRLNRTMSLGGTVTIEERGYLARSFLASKEGTAIQSECELRVLKSGGSTLVTQKVAKHVRRYATGFLTQTWVISKRAITAVLRNPETSVMQILAFIMSGLIVGTFYHGQLTNDGRGIEDRVGCMFVISYMVIFGQLTSIELFIQERALFIHEKTSGFYRTSAYFIAKVFCEIVPTRIVPTLFFALISAYMIGLRTDPMHFFMYWLVLTGTNLASTSLCLMVSAMVPVYSIGFLVAALFNVFFMISSGFLLNTSHMPPFLLPFKYMSIFRYNLNVLLTLDLHDREFTCTMDPTAKRACLPNGDVYLDSKDIDPDRIWDNIIALYLMSPCYLLLCYLVLRKIKKTT